MNEITIQLHGLSNIQHVIADFLWEAQTEAEVQEVYETFDPREVKIVEQLMLAAVIDDVEDVSEANDVLKSFML